MTDERPSHIDLFSGFGGFSIAAQEAEFVTIGHAEVEQFACAVYHRRFPKSVCFGGVENVTRTEVLRRCGCLPTVVSGGFPCQPHSLAGDRLASSDDRDLWGECVRVVGDLRPRFALFENVRGLLTSERGLFFNRILSDVAALGYSCMWQVISAADVGAPHLRERVWLILVDELSDAHDRARGGQPRQQQGEGAAQHDRGRKLADGQGRKLKGEHVRQGDRVGQAGRDRDVARPGGGGTGQGVAHADHSGQQAMRPAVSVREEHAAAQRSGDGWPALRGLWPSRPGQPQFGWEPPRVVGHAEERKGDVGGDRDVGETSGERRRGDDAATDAGQGVEHSESDGRQRLGDVDRAQGTEAGGHPDGPGEGLVDSRRGSGEGSRREVGGEEKPSGREQAQPALGGVSDGLPTAMGGDRGAVQKTWPPVTNRVGQLKGYGNAIVPINAMIFFDAIMQELRKVR